MSTHGPEDSDRIAEALHDAVKDVRAPHSLRAEVARTRLRSAPPTRTRRRTLYAGATGALAAGAAAIVRLMSGGAGGPSIADAAQAALRPPTSPAPAARADGTLPVSVGGVSFPGTSLVGDWRPVGARSDTVDGRRVRTITYASDGRIAAYTIVDGTALAVPDGARRTRYAGIDAATFTRNGTTIVTWRRSGRTCILASANADASRLLDFAAGE